MDKLAFHLASIDIKRGRTEEDDESSIVELARQITDTEHGLVYEGPSFAVGVTQQGRVLSFRFKHREDYHAVEIVARRLKFNVVHGLQGLELYLVNWQTANRYEIILALLQGMWHDAHLRWK